MPVEIERKFRVAGTSWQTGVTRVRKLRQAYLTKAGELSLRVRIDGDETATLTLKTARVGIERQEYEYPIPVADALELITKREGSLIVKTRHIVPYCGHDWEIDVFADDNAGLVLAEIELPSADAVFQRPEWIGEEITNDKRFYNADLARTPFCFWPERQRMIEAA